MNVQEALKVVSELVEYHDNQATECYDRQYDEDGNMHSKIVKELGELNNLLEDLGQKVTPPSSSINILPSELEGLPDELKEQLSKDDFEAKILQIMEDLGGTISLDRFILEWYNRHKEILQRRTVTAKLYRMAKSQTIYNVGSRGIYSLYNLKLNKDSQDAESGEREGEHG